MVYIEVFVVQKEYPIKPVDNMKENNVAQLSLLSGKSNN